MRIHINVGDERWRKVKIDFKKIARAALIPENKNAELSITLANDDEIRALNKKYRGMDKATNVLAFESGDKDLLGDVFVSYDTALREEPKNLAAHAAHLIVHGVLHLQGFDHIEDKDAEIMEAKEEEILGRLPPPSWRRWLERLALVCVGALGALGFAPNYFWWLTVLSLGAAYWMMTRNKSLWWWGAGYGIANFHWCLESIFANDEIARALWWMYPIGFAAIMAGSALVFGFPFWMTRLTGRAGAARTISFALAWAFVLWLREWLLTGIPWNPLANITLPFSAVSWLMSAVGALGLTWLLVGAISAIPEYIASRAKWQFLFFAPLLLAPIMGGGQIAAPSGKRVLIIQPSYDMNQKFDTASAAERLDKLVEMSKGAGPADLIVWPETAYPYFIGGNAARRLPALGAEFALGAIYLDFDLDKAYNAMILADGEGNIIDKYFKSHLVPFGEYRPLGDWLPTPGNLSAGPGPRIMGDFAPAICYEIVFSASLLPKGAKPKFILNITNDAWFGQSWGPKQHLDMARRQAIETGLPVVRANNGGISAIIDGRGRVLASLPLGAEGTLGADIPGTYAAPYRFLGLGAVMLLLTALTILMLFGTKLFAKKRVV